jgi:NADH-quinone oxidoreductase subunit A
MAVAIYVIGVVIVVSVMLGSYFLGARGRDKSRNYPYESGVKALKTFPSRFFVHYFLVAIAFVVFDLESVFLYLWSSSVRSLSWPGFFQVLFFVSMLLLALVYAFHMGIFDFFTKPKNQEEQASCTKHM